MTLVEQLHPAINAVLNLTSSCSCSLGRVAIARGDDALHRKRMLAAFTASTVFLVSYLIRFATTGTHKYPGDGLGQVRSTWSSCSRTWCSRSCSCRSCIGALRRALRGEFEAHKRLVKFTWPIWIYVSVTGVLVYLMLYHLAPVLNG